MPPTTPGSGSLGLPASPRLRSRRGHRLATCPATCLAWGLMGLGLNPALLLTTLAQWFLRHTASAPLLGTGLWISTVPRLRF